MNKSLSYLDPRIVFDPEYFKEPIILWAYAAAFAIVAVAAWLTSVVLESQSSRRVRLGETEYRQASLFRRFLAYIFDVVAVSALIWWMVTDFLADPSSAAFNNLAAWGMIMIISLAMTVLCSVIPEGRWGRTPGKLLLGIRVVGPEGNPPGFGKALIRNLLRLVDGALWGLVGVYIFAISTTHQRLGDQIAVTYVVGRKIEGPPPGM
jgi:uncharacterized RDD family membrane protein YckC